MNTLAKIKSEIEKLAGGKVTLTFISDSGSFSIYGAPEDVEAAKPLFSKVARFDSEYYSDALGETFAYFNPK